MPDYSINWTDQYAADWSRLIGHLSDQPCKVIEVGCWEGRSTAWLLKNVCTHSASRLTAIDPHFNGERYSRFLANVSASPFVSRLETVRDFSADYLGTLPDGSVDAVYIDGSHEGIDVMTDAVLSWRLLKPGGTIIFDDYKWTGDRLVLPCVAIDAFTELVAPWSEVVLKSYQFALRKVAHHV